MALRTWSVWGISAVLAGGLTAAAKPPAAVPAPPGVDGQATPAVTQEHFQAEPIPAPRPLPESVRTSVPSRYAPPTAEAAFADALAGLDLTPPFQLVSATANSPRALTKARAAFEMAELHFRSCDAEEARRWYREVVTQAPGSAFALVAAERLSRATTALYQTAEPPLADPPARNP